LPNPEISFLLSFLYGQVNQTDIFIAKYHLEVSGIEMPMNEINIITLTAAHATMVARLEMLKS
jgi:hypothetical protein